jgi:HPt (histidine-containing phosphotransfer) domain-containing protein
MSMEEVLQKLKETYINEFPEKISMIKKLLASKNSDELSNFFHQLKGSGRTYGLPEVSIYSKILEFNCRSNIDKVYNLASKIEDDFTKIYEYRLKNLQYPIEDSEVFITLNDID